MPCRDKKLLLVEVTTKRQTLQAFIVLAKYAFGVLLVFAHFFTLFHQNWQTFGAMVFGFFLCRLQIDSVGGIGQCSLSILPLDHNY